MDGKKSEHKRFSLFIEFKHEELPELEKLKTIPVDNLIVSFEPLKKSVWEQLKTLGIPLSLSLEAFEQDICPASPRAEEKLEEKLKDAARFSPEEIWLDHFRFDGHWEVKTKTLSGLHFPCQFCRGRERKEILRQLSIKIRRSVPPRIKLGYFAVPFKDKERPEIISQLGQDHKNISQPFDIISPMLYHRMIGKPIEYISEYVAWLAQETQKPILPIIQIKDMPDNLPDKLSEEEIGRAFREAQKDPSIGTAVFSWDHALEKKKTGILASLPFV